MKSLLATKLVIALGALPTLTSILLINHSSICDRALAQLERHQNNMLLNALVEVQQLAATLDIDDTTWLQSGLNSLARLPGTASSADRIKAWSRCRVPQRQRCGHGAFCLRIVIFDTCPLAAARFSAPLKTRPKCSTEHCFFAANQR